MAVRANWALAQSMALASTFMNKLLIIVIGFLLFDKSFVKDHLCSHSLLTGLFHHLTRNEIRLLPLLGMGAYIVGEEEKFEHPEDDNELDDDDSPQGTSNGHVSESIHIEVNDSAKEIHKKSFRVKVTGSLCKGQPSGYDIHRGICKYSLFFFMSQTIPNFSLTYRKKNVKIGHFF